MAFMTLGPRCSRAALKLFLDLDHQVRSRQFIFELGDAGGELGILAQDWIGWFASRSRSHAAMNCLSPLGHRRGIDPRSTEIGTFGPVFG
jgi:hypothetical protein